MERVAKQRFIDLRVKEVSIVAAPANEEEFAVIKTADQLAEAAAAAALANKETTMATGTAQVPVAKDASVGDEWIPMCFGKSCDSMSNLCRACPAKSTCSELCHMNVPPDEPNTQEYKPSNSAGKQAEGIFPSGGASAVSKENAMSGEQTQTDVEKAKKCPDCGGDHKPGEKCVEKAANPVEQKGDKKTDDQVGGGKKAKTPPPPDIAPGKAANGGIPASLEATKSKVVSDALQRDIMERLTVLKEVDPEGFNAMLALVPGKIAQGPLVPQDLSSKAPEGTMGPSGGVTGTPPLGAPAIDTAERNDAPVIKQILEGVTQVVAKQLEPLQERLKKVEEVKGVPKALPEGGNDGTTKVEKEQKGFWHGVI